MKCEYPECDRDEEVLFYCPYCHHSFCQEHRAPEKHKCPVYFSHANPLTGTGATIQDHLRAFAESIQKQAEEAQYQQYMQMDIETKKKLIAKKLLASPDIFSFGDEIVDLIAGFGLIIAVFTFSQVVFMKASLIWSLLISSILIGTAFLPHELAHKFVAIKKGQFARYVLWTRGILFTLITLFIGIGLVVPGFVAIVPLDPKKRMNKKENGLVAFAGPATNTIVGAISLLIGLPIYYHLIPIILPSVIQNIFLQIAMFNSLLALFNCIPVWQLDGKKILTWSKLAFFALIVLNVIIAIPPFMYQIKLM